MKALIATFLTLGIWWGFIELDGRFGIGMQGKAKWYWELLARLIFMSILTAVFAGVYSTWRWALK